ncbi:hypothetical protein CMV_009657 [Castanea mollissima]|uniref:Uncharacterized protein n=1 Tax=Castanea mollissima TaxID=60419 RepID=A0A8J4RH93_9ROSI|nr:hypothetical protein CMV_009657 [Castanea mollissima]
MGEANEGDKDKKLKVDEEARSLGILFATHLGATKSFLYTPSWHIDQMISSVITAEFSTFNQEVDEFLQRFDLLGDIESKVS